MRSSLFAAATLALAACGGVDESAAGPGAGAREEPSAVARRLAARVLELEEELAGERTARAALERELEALLHELARCEETRMQREEEWLNYSRLVSSLDPKSLPPDVRFRSDLQDEVDERDAVERAALERRDERTRAVYRSLRSLLVLEGVRTFDLLEIGALKDGWTGPVVMRLLDHEGRLAGSLYAERLRLEGSRSARTLTLVLEDGYESRAGIRIPFGTDLTARAPASAPPENEVPDGASPDMPERKHAAARNQRRIVLPEVDPMPWLEAMPELFGGSPIDERIDDGNSNVAVLRHSLNSLLREDAADGHFRLVSIGGVVDDTLHVVHLEEIGPGGARERRVFADRLRLRTAERGIVLELFDGAVMRGSRKAPFLEGVLRIYLPRARQEAWRAAGIPGLEGPVGDGGGAREGEGTGATEPEGGAEPRSS